jgi:hypothetical protein
MPPLLDAILAGEAIGAQGIECLRVKATEITQQRYPDATRAEVTSAALFVHDLATLPAKPSREKSSSRQDFALRAIQCFLGYDPARQEGQGFEPPISMFETTDSVRNLARYVLLRSIDIMCFHDANAVASRMVSDILQQLRNRAHKDDISSIGKKKFKRFDTDTARARRLADLIADNFNPED